MKKINLLILMTLLPFFAFAQKNEKDEDEYRELQTIFKDDFHGGYGAISISYFEMYNKDAVSIGGRGGWIIGHGLSIGLGGEGYFNDFDSYEKQRSNQITYDVSYNLVGGHGGLIIEPILLPRFPVHLSIPVFIGAGGISYIEDQYGVESDSYFIGQPGVELELNLIRHFRLAIGAYYVYTTQINIDNTPPELDPIPTDVLSNGLKVGMVLKFGRF
ncbi:hypothetical protein ACFLSA_04640 [Bacteroidota bacterium]